MKEYLMMKDFFPDGVCVGTEEWMNGWFEVRHAGGTSIDESCDGGYSERDANYVAHAINSHDELVSKLDVAESTIYEVERVLSEMQRNGAFGLDDVIAEVECCIKRISE